MEDALALKSLSVINMKNNSLNPCCNGRCTRTCWLLPQLFSGCDVLILVVMEDALAH